MSLLESVPDPAHVQDVAGIGRIGFHLPPQPVNVPLDDLPCFVRIQFALPHHLYQLLRRHHAGGILHQVSQELEFLGRQVQRLSIANRHVLFQVNEKAPTPDLTPLRLAAKILPPLQRLLHGLPLLVAVALAGNKRRSRKRQRER